VNTFGTYDFETYDWTKPLCMDLFDGAEHEYAIDRKHPTEVVRAALFGMEASEVPVWWAHNGGKYDALFMVDCIRQLKGWKCDGAVAAGRLISLRVMTPNGVFTLKDSYAVIQASLDKALSSFEIPHKKVFTKEDYESLDKDKRGMRKFSDVKLRVGCQADTEALHALVTKAEAMFVEWGGALKSTFSASALTVVKAQVGVPLPSHEGNQWANDIGRKAYCGGRVEVFKHSPADTLNEMDVTSSYPWSMTQRLPWELLGYGDPRLYDANQLSIVYAKVTVPEQYIPPLPYVPPTGGLFFPWGEWSGWFTSAELVDAIENCGVSVKMHAAINYTSKTPFEQYVSKVFKVKSESTGALREFTKLILNGSYGKFGQKPENTKLQMFDSAEEGLLWARKNAHREPIAMNRSNTAWQIKTHRWPKQTHYAMASFITAYSRILLRKHLQYAHNNGGLAYCDTDSIHCPSSIEWDTGDELGGLKYELRDYRACFYAPKLYELHPVAPGSEPQCFRPPDKDDRYKPTFASKGFPVSPEAFARIIQGERVGNPKGRMQLLKSQLRNDSGVQHLSESETAKQWSGRSNKRCVIANHPEGDTRAWHVAELHEGKHEMQQSPLAPVAIEPLKAVHKRKRK